MKRTILFIIISLFIFGCKNKKNTSYGDCDIDSIVVKYFHKDITFSRPPRGIDILNWKSVKKHEALKNEDARIIDTVITNCHYLEKIKEVILTLEKGKCYDENAFLTSIIYYQNNDQDTLCFSYANGFNLIKLNQVCYQESRKLEHLLFKYSDYYHWFPDSQDSLSP